MICPCGQEWTWIPTPVASPHTAQIASEGLGDGIARDY
jgi:hypothetical protein